MMTRGRLLKQAILLIHKLMSNISGLQRFSVFDFKKLKYLVTLTANQGCHTLSNSYTSPSLCSFFVSHAHFLFLSTFRSNTCLIAQEERQSHI